VFLVWTDAGYGSAYNGNPGGEAEAPRVVAPRGFLQAYVAEGANGVFGVGLPYRLRTVKARPRHK
jgi:hypothetical protein